MRVSATVALFLLMALVMPSSMLSARASGDISAEHHVELFTTAARLSGDGRRWIVPVHAWIYTPQHSRVRKAALARVFQSKFDIAPAPATQANFDRRANLLFADNHRGRRLAVRIAGRTFELPPTAPNGHARAEFEVPVADVPAGADAGTGRLAIEAILPAGDLRTFAGTSLLIAPDGLSVISDIDDTVKISQVTNRARLMGSTFFKDFETVPDMGALYAGWAREGVAVHFVSSSPWHLYAPLREMLDANGFPPSALELKQIRLTDSTLLNLFKDASKTKPPAIAAILAAFPRRRFVLVGDSGEKDPEIYADFMRRHPGRIAQILIRNVTGAAPGDARFATVFAGIDPAAWQLFDAPAEIRWVPR